MNGVLLSFRLSSVSLLAVFLLCRSVVAEAPITAAAIAPGGMQAVLASQSGITICSWPELAGESMLSTALANVHDLRFSPDGTTLLVAGGAPAETGEVEVRRWPGGKVVQRIDGHQDVVYRVAWSPDGRRWAAASGDGSCRIYDAQASKTIAKYDGHSRAVLSLVFLNNSTVASVGVDQTIRVWEINEDHSVAHLRTLDNHLSTVNQIDARPGTSGSATIMAATISEDRTVRLWQPKIGRLVRFARLDSTPRAFAWSSDGRRLIIGCNDGSIRIVETSTMRIINQVPGLCGRVHELAWDSQQEQLLVAGEDGCRAVKLE